MEDEGLKNVSVGEIVAAGKQLFLTGSTSKYGRELYAGKVHGKTGTFAVVAVNSKVSAKPTATFNALLYPNPVASEATLQITGNAKNVYVSLADMGGKKLWESTKNNTMFVNLPTIKLAAGNYIVTVRSGDEHKTITLVKQ